MPVDENSVPMISVSDDFDLLPEQRENVRLDGERFTYVPNVGAIEVKKVALRVSDD